MNENEKSQQTNAELSTALYNLLYRNCGEVMDKKLLIEKMRSEEGLDLSPRGFGKKKISELSMYVGFELDVTSYVEHNPFILGYDTKRIRIRIKDEI